MLSVASSQFRLTSVGQAAAAVSADGAVGGVGSAPSSEVTISCGRCDAELDSLEETPSESLEVVASAKAAVPLPNTNGVTSYSTYVPADSAPLSSCAPLVRGARLFQVIAVSAPA